MKSKTKRIITVLAMLTLSSLLIVSVNANTFPNLPTDPVNLTLTVGPTLEDRWPGAVTFEGIDEGVVPSYDVENNLPYVAWCAQFDNSIDPLTPYEALLISHPDLENPALIETEIWNKINWLLNQGYTENQAVQFAIWLLLGTTNGQISARYDGAVNEALLADANDMVDAADLDPESGNFVPSAGQTVAVYCDVTDYYGDTEEEAQDLIIELEIPSEYEGMTPGFWKNHEDCWDEYDADDSFESIFGVDITINAQGKKLGNGDPTLIEALNARGGVNIAKSEYGALIRHAVAALLNADHPEINYPWSEAEIIDAVANAINGLRDAGQLKDMLDNFNNAGGGIDAHCLPI